MRQMLEPGTLTVVINLLEDMKNYLRQQHLRSKAMMLQPSLKLPKQVVQGPKKAPGLGNTLFEFFIGVRSSLKARLPNKIFQSKAKSLYYGYSE